MNSLAEKSTNIQPFLPFVCDICLLPLNLLGEDYVDLYKKGHVEPLHCLCSLRSEEVVEVEVAEQCSLLF